MARTIVLVRCVPDCFPFFQMPKSAANIIAVKNAIAVGQPATQHEGIKESISMRPVCHRKGME